jgi:Mg/Co/Ni transporter MgtE
MSVEEHMSKEVVFVRESTNAGAALAVAERENVHYLLVVDDAHQLAGVTCACALARAPVSDNVGSFAKSPVTCVLAGDTLERAAQVMQSWGVGCLPVVRAPGEVVGVITRHDLRRQGTLGDEEARRCAACGATHDLVEGEHQVPFCRSCLACTPEPGSVAREWYFTLGGGD